MDASRKTDWQTERRTRDERLAAARPFATGKMVPEAQATALLEAIIRPGDRVCLEGDNQKQADFLAASLAGADPKILHDLHIVQSGIVLPEHIDLFEKGIARKLDFSYSGPQGGAISRALDAGKIELGAIHTYIELFGRYFIDLTPSCRGSMPPATRWISWSPRGSPSSSSRCSPATPPRSRRSRSWRR